MLEFLRLARDCGLVVVRCIQLRWNGTVLLAVFQPLSDFMPRGDAHGVKQDKKLLTLLLTASWMGEKEKHLMIWKSENLRALKGATRANSRWRASHRKAWMTIALFKRWIKEFDSHKDSQGRKVLLLIANMLVHRNDMLRLIVWRRHRSPFSQPTLYHSSNPWIRSWARTDSNHLLLCVSRNSVGMLVQSKLFVGEAQRKS